MRLIGLTENAPFVLNVSEEGSILGSAGNLRPELFQKRALPEGQRRSILCPLAYARRGGI